MEGGGGGGGKETLVKPEDDLLLVQIKESDRFIKIDRFRKINRFNYAATFDKFVVCKLQMENMAALWWKAQTAQTTMVFGYY